MKNFRKNFSAIANEMPRHRIYNTMKKGKKSGAKGRGRNATASNGLPSKPVSLSGQAKKISISLGEPAWLLEKRLEAVALLEKRNGRAEISGKFSEGKLVAEAECEGNAVALGMKPALGRGNALKEQLGKPFTGKEPDNYLVSFALFTEAIVVAVDSGMPARVKLSLSGKPPEHFALFFLFSDHSVAEVMVKREFAQSANECMGVLVGKGAAVEFCSLQNNGPETDSAAGMSVQIGEGAKLKFLNSNLGGSKREEQVLMLQHERGSRCGHYEASLSKAAQRITKDSDHLHTAPDTYSRSIFKYATAGSSRVKVDGKVTIEKTAPGSDTHLLAKSLLLSEKSISRLVPQLFVRNADVMAGHGSAMAPLDKEELFYLESRGIGENEGRLLILQGFLREILVKSEISKWLSESMEQELFKSAEELYPRD